MSDLEIAGKLGFKDFIAFVLPGFTVLLGVALLVRGIAPGDTLFTFPQETALQVCFGVAVIALSWVLGVASAEALRGVERKSVRRLAAKSALLGPAGKAFEATCEELWGNKLPVDPEHIYESFYVCRAVVRELLPAAKSKMDRAGALRQAAKNVAVPFAIFGFGATVWAASLPSLALRYALIAVFLAGTLLGLRSLIIGAAKARLREIREAFWSIAALPALRKMQLGKSAEVRQPS